MRRGVGPPGRACHKANRCVPVRPRTNTRLAVRATRPGIAAGVTLGLAVSAGGLFMPLLGLVAERHGPQGAIAVLAIVPVIAILVSAALREPSPGQEPDKTKARARSQTDAARAPLAGSSGSACGPRARAAVPRTS